MNKLLYIILISAAVGYFWGALLSDSNAQADYRKTIYDLQQDKTMLIGNVTTCEEQIRTMRYGALGSAPQTQNGW